MDPCATAAGTTNTTGTTSTTGTVTTNTGANANFNLGSLPKIDFTSQGLTAAESDRLNMFTQKSMEKMKEIQTKC